MSEKEFKKQADILLGKKDYKGSLKLANQEIKKKPDYLYAWYIKGISLYWLKEYKKSKDVIAKIINDWKKAKAVDWFFLARCDKELKKYPEAIKGLNKSLEIDPKYQKSLAALEFCYREIKDYKNAIRVNKVGAEFYPRIIYFWYWLSYSYYQLNDIENSLTYIFKGIRLYPESKEAQELYKSILKDFRKSFKSKQEFDAIRDMKIGDTGFGTLNLNEKGLDSLKQVDFLEYTKLIMYRLKLEGNNIEDISCLDGFSGLMILELDDNIVTSISGLKDLPKLKNLELSNNKLSSLDGLENLESLETLELSSNQIKKMVNLANLSKLMRIELDDNQIKKIEGLEKSVRIYKIDLSENHIEKIEGLNNLPNLKTLDLSNNSIKKIEGLTKSSLLEDLNLNFNEIEKIEGLDNLTAIKYLKISNNRIKIIEGVDKLRKLKALDLSNNQIDDIDGLKYLFELTTLNLSGNQIKTMKDFGQMKQLALLNLSNNNLSTIDNLDLLSSLTYLNLENNPNLPDFIAVAYRGAKDIANLRKYNGMSIEQLQEIDKQEKQKEKLRLERRQKAEIQKEEQRKEKIRVEKWIGGFYETRNTSNYGSKHNLRDRFNALMKLNELGSCLYCSKSIPNTVNFVKVCTSALDQLLDDTDDSLPYWAKDRDDYTERKITEQVTNRRMDIYDRPGYSTVTRTVRDYSDALVGKFSIMNFPKLQGYVCKNCSDEYIKKISRSFKRLQRRRFKKTNFADTIQKSMRRCHERYMKIFESMLEKRGF